MQLPSPIHLRRNKHFRRTVVGAAYSGGMGNLAAGDKLHISSTVDTQVRGASAKAAQILLAKARALITVRSQ